MKNQHDLAEGWFNKGNNDIKIAQAGLGIEDAYDTICFHAQQAVEKYLKGFIELHGQVAPKTHNLLQLYELCGDYKTAWDIDEQTLSTLTEYAVETRYQLDFLPDKATATDALEKAKAICQIVLRTQNKLKEDAKAKAEERQDKLI